MGISGGEKTEKEIEGIFETRMTKNFLKLMSNTNPQIHEAQRTLSRINAPKIKPRFIIYKLQKITIIRRGR